jgi:hypothetical protein
MSAVCCLLSAVCCVLCAVCCVLSAADKVREQTLLCEVIFSFLTISFCRFSSPISYFPLPQLATSAPVRGGSGPPGAAGGVDGPEDLPPVNFSTTYFFFRKHVSKNLCVYFFSFSFIFIFFSNRFLKILLQNLTLFTFASLQVPQARH